MGALTNTKHERFAQELAKGKTADEAYVDAGYKPDRGNAARLTANDSIQRRVAELQERAAQSVVVTITTIADQLDEDRALAHAANQAGAAVAATMAKAKLYGLVVERSEVKSEVVGPTVDRPPPETREEWLARRQRELGQVVQ